ncbi:hypothetical protein MASR2M78_07090 [Treponema sp.]
MTDKLLSRYIGVSSTDIDEDEIAAILIETGIFENIRVSTLPLLGGTELSVTVDEKWSILPLPVFVAGSDGITAGAALIDANAFGLNDKIFAVALLLPSGWMTSIAYINVADDERSPSFRLSTFISNQDKENVDTSEDLVRKYPYFAFDFGAGFGFPVFPKAELSLGTRFRERSIDDTETDVLKAPNSSRVIAVQTGLSYNSSDWDGVFLSQRSFNSEVAYNFGLVGDSFYGLAARVSWDQPFFPGFRSSIKAAFSYAPDSPAAFEEGPSDVGITILTSDYSSPVLAGGALGLEGRVVKFPFGSLSALASYQLFVSDSPLTGNDFAHGPVGGIRLYIAKVAIPALDIGVAYNIETSIVKASFGIGMRM